MSWRQAPSDYREAASEQHLCVRAVTLPSISCMHHSQRPFAVKPLWRQNLDLFTRKAWGCYVALTALVGREWQPSQIGLRSAWRPGRPPGSSSSLVPTCLLLQKQADSWPDVVRHGDPSSLQHFPYARLACFWFRPPSLQQSWCARWLSAASQVPAG